MFLILILLFLTIFETTFFSNFWYNILFIIKNQRRLKRFYSYQSADGTQRQESGGLKYPSAPGLLPTLSVQGSYAAITPEGNRYNDRYS